ncbi:testisin-like [Puma concolor]|uniref:Testisin-like n=1 Tax=Puma concolor TaxID=9696 RepID=A0A6P6HA96_PUMCO|nr:testisin-like [Puma concolor]
MGARVRALLLAQLLVRAGLRGPQPRARVSVPGPCGRRTVSTTRVVGGKDSELGRWPWQGSLRLWGAHHCGASLLNRCWVLSAAHCFEKHKDPSKWTAQFGELSSRPTSWKLWTFYHRYRVKDIVVYPQFSGTSLKDIALLKLSSSVTYNKYIQPICVVASSSEFQNKADCWVTGWGHIKEGQGSTGVHHKQLQVRRPGFLSYDPGDMICAGSENGQRDACKVSTPAPTRALLDPGTTPPHLGPGSNPPGAHQPTRVYS